MGLITDLTGIADSILGIRDSIGAVIQPVYLVTRTWTGTEPGLGSFSDVVAQVLPSPAIQSLQVDLKAQPAGTRETSEYLIKGISKQSYTTRAAVDCTSSAKNVEKFYRIASKIYNVVKVEESYITWNVKVREAAHQG